MDCCGLDLWWIERWLEELREHPLVADVRYAGLLGGVEMAEGASGDQVVDYAERLFLNGDRAKAIDRRGFDRVIAVFDRDDLQKQLGLLFGEKQYYVPLG